MHSPLCIKANQWLVARQHELGLVVSQTCTFMTVGTNFNRETMGHLFYTTASVSHALKPKNHASPPYTRPIRISHY